MNVSDQNPGPLAAVILAAGKGTRMKSDRHKVLHHIGGRPMLDHLFASLEQLNVEKSVLIVGAQKEQLKVYGKRAEMAVQDPQLGTGHAVALA